MGKRLNPGQFRIGFVLFALALTALTASGCARQDSNADEQRRGSLYGGVTGDGADRETYNITYVNPNLACKGTGHA